MKNGKEKNTKNSCHCGRGPAIQAVYEGKTLIKRLDPGSTSGMTTTKAFTLIELLVVVLIIGILSAIALPMYQASVEKTYIANLMQSVKPIADEEEVYYLANGSYTNDLNILPFAFEKKLDDSHGYFKENFAELSDKAKISFDIKNGKLDSYTRTRNSGVLWLLNHNALSGSCYPQDAQIICIARSSNKAANQACKSFGPYICQNSCLFLTQDENTYDSCKFYRVK